jgi:hypothetical protein
MNLRTLAALTGLLLCASVATAAPPTTINYQGVLRDDVGAPMTGSQDLTFRIFDDETAGQEVWSEPVTVDAVGGVFEAVLGVSIPLTADLFDGGPLWLQLEVGVEVLTPRQVLTSVPWALRAGQSDLADVATTAAHATTADTATALAVPTPTGALVPVGGIIDYFAFDVGAALPEGFEVCDGTTVADGDSPWFGMAKPNLVDQFVLGVATAGETGSTGGTNTSDLSHDHSTSDHSHGLPSHAHTAPSHNHSMAHTHTGPSHTHSGPSHSHSGPSHTHSVVGGSHSHTVNNHRHKSAFWNTSVNRWQVRDSGGGSVSLKGTNVADGTGDDYVWSRGASAADESEYTWSSGPGSTNAASPGTVTSGSGGTGSTGSSGTASTGSGGTGNTSGSSAGSTGNGGASATTSSSGTSDAAGASTTGTGGLASHDNRPAYVGLLKLIRVR